MSRKWLKSGKTIPKVGRNEWKVGKMVRKLVKKGDFCECACIIPLLSLTTLSSATFPYSLYITPLVSCFIPSSIYSLYSTPPHNYPIPSSVYPYPSPVIGNAQPRTHSINPITQHYSATHLYTAFISIQSQHHTKPYSVV